MIFQRLILKQLLKFQSLWLSFFLSIYIFIDFLEKNTRYFPSHRTSAGTIFAYYFFQVPKMTLHVLPFTSLLSFLFVLWLLWRTGQLLALKSFGLSPLRIAQPLFFFGFCMSTLHFVLAETVLPISQNYFKEIEAYKIENSPLEKMFFETHWLRGESGILYYKNINRAKGILYQVEFFSYDDKKMTIIHGEQALFDEKKKAWVILNLERSLFPSPPTQSVTEHMSFFVTPVHYQPTLMLEERISSDQIDIFTLWETIKKSRESGNIVRSREYDFYQKMVQPLLTILYMLFALPFLLLKERQADNYFQVVICFSFIIVYNIATTFFKNLTQMGVVHPMAAAWLPLLGLFFIGLLQCNQIRKESL